MGLRLRSRLPRWVGSTAQYVNDYNLKTHFTVRTSSIVLTEQTNVLQTTENAVSLDFVGLKAIGATVLMVRLNAHSLPTTEPF